MIKKVLIFSLAYYPDFVGGAEVAIKEITDRVPKEEAFFDMVTAKLNSNQKRFEVVGNINVYRVGLGFERIDKFLIPILGFLKAYSLQRQNRYSIVWTMMANQASVAASFFKLFYRKIPLVLTIQEGDEEEHLKRYVFGNEWLYRILIKPWHLLVFKLANRATAISFHLKKRIENNNFKGRIDIVPNGVDLSIFSKEYSKEELDSLKKALGIKKNEKIIITTSRLVDKNAVDDIISSLKYLPKKYKLLILGTGSLLYKLQNLVDKEDLYERVKFAGFVEKNEIPKYLKIADVFVRPSISEGMGNSFIESFAAGIPVVATSVGGIKDFLVHKETGLICEVRNPEDIALKVKLLERDESLRKSIISNASKLAHNYDWNIVAKMMNSSIFNLDSFTLKIVIATGIFPPKVGGPSYYAFNLFKEFKGLGHSVKVVTYTWESKLPSGIRHLAYFFKLLFNSIGADFILALDTFSVGLPSVWVKKVLGKKLLIRTGGDFLWEDFIQKEGKEILLSDFYNHKNSFSKRSKKIFNLTKNILNNSNAIIFSTKWQENIFNKAYNLDTEKNYIVENSYREKEKSFLPQKKNFLWAGRAIPLKNVERLKKAFNKAQKEDSEIILDIMLNPAHEVLMEKMKNCYAFILPSISDISPNLILRAISFNKPFICTKETGIYDRVKDIGVFVDPLNEEDIKDKILFVANENNYAELKEKIERFDFIHSYRDIAKEILYISQKS